MKRRFSWNGRIAAGTVIGIITPLLAVPLIMLLLSWAQNFYFAQLWSKFWHDQIIQSKILSLSIIPNLACFYLFLNRERYDIAKGIIIGSACFLPYILYVNFS